MDSHAWLQRGRPPEELRDGMAAACQAAGTTEAMSTSLIVTVTAMSMYYVDVTFLHMSTHAIRDYVEHGDGANSTVA